MIWGPRSKDCLLLLAVIFATGTHVLVRKATGVRHAVSSYSTGLSRHIAARTRVHHQVQSLPCELTLHSHHSQAGAN